MNPGAEQLKVALYASNLDLTYVIDSLPRLPIACTRHVSYISRIPLAEPFCECHVGGLTLVDVDL